uniref:Uncharacterized protein n=1 Tax=Alexandrium catenella TaxID=2925 RepID=A0A7S1RJ13_ALECA|mmetsp:Transcript_58890/g.157779  ORF Transcript_58890/g.157779 Transcript_58890/m.157779 type:complete len:144 (+) Transcript_58890:161-592(+)
MWAASSKFSGVAGEVSNGLPTPRVDRGPEPAQEAGILSCFHMARSTCSYPSWQRCIIVACPVGVAGLLHVGGAEVGGAGAEKPARELRAVRLAADYLEVELSNCPADPATRSLAGSAGAACDGGYNARPGALCPDLDVRARCC